MKPIIVKRTVDDLPGGKPICDCCGADNPVAAFPARAFVIGVVTSEGTYTQHYQDDGWAACAWCAPLIAANDLERLVQRYLVMHPSINQMPRAAYQFMVDLIRLQHGEFLKARTGPPTPLTPEAPR